MSNDVRVRFAPSPTGYLHVGGVRTALYNWLFARHNGGKFVLRLEDTDLERSTDEAIGWILDGLKWLHLDWDEGPYRQTERFDLYNEHIDRLIEQGKAYRCYCTPEELELRRKKAMVRGGSPKYDGRCRRLKDGDHSGPYTIRFKAPQEGTIIVNDLIRGPVLFDESQMDDLIIRRSNGNPTYNLTVVVDDALMGITHVIRGEDHLSNTPRQIQLYQALGYGLPQFGHMPMILGTDKKRLSKRHGASSITEFREMGYLWEAMVNYLVRLGWSYGDQEIFSIDELVDKFTLEKVNKSAAVFDLDKLVWLNQSYLKSLPEEEVAGRLVPFLEAKGLLGDGPDIPWLPKAVITLRERTGTLVEMADQCEFYFRELEYDQEAAGKFLTSDIAPLLEKVSELISRVEVFTQESLHEAFRSFLEAEGIKLKVIAQPLRIALTYRRNSPGLFEVMEVLGKDKTLRRIQRACDWILASIGRHPSPR
ncbi:MAG: glutamate--tRNA ligase [Deltaproteobacteria bacterium]|nr:glutamate--tRNA ligase [Deltaproteobacteria bacterium]